MALFKHFYSIIQWPGKDSPVSCRCWFLLLACLLPMPVLAQKLSVHVLGHKGGKIVVPDRGECLSDCEVWMPRTRVYSLFAVPASGYRFAGWKGVCRDTIGPLCTLSVGQEPMVSARFVATAAMPEPVKALLLVHGSGANAFVWNDFVGRYFENRCPVIYGGIILDDDASNPANQVYCYRVKSGYYDRFFQGLDQQGMREPASDLAPEIAPPREYLANEIKAAVLGILNRHPDSSLVVVGQGDSGLAARSGLQYENDLPGHIVGWLALADTAPQHLGKKGLVDDAKLEGDHHGQFLSMDVRPDQIRKLNKALRRLAPAWW